MSGWTELPSGSDVAIAPGFTYAVLASVSKSVSKAAILAKVPAGVEVLDFEEQGPGSSLAVDPNPDHRSVAVKFFSRSYAGTLPWKSPWPTTIYALTRAWAASGSAATVPSSTSSSSPAWPWVVVAVGGSALGLWLWHRSRRPRRRRSLVTSSA